MRDVEHKWLEHDGNAPFIETRRTPDIENMDPEQYRQSITQLVLAFVSVKITIAITKSIVMRNAVCYSMNTSLSEIQADIQRLANQQNQIQQQHLMSQHQKQMQHQLQQLQSLSQQHMQVRMPEVHPASHHIVSFSNFYLADLRNATDESVNAQIARSATITVLFARSAASAKENVGPTGTHSKSGQ